MCENCREEVREILIALLQGDHELCSMVRDTVHDAVEQIREAGKEIPEGLEEQLYEAGIAGQVAVGAAHLARMTDPELTEEGGLDVPIILGLWAGTMMHARIEEAAEEHFIELAKQLLGMSNN